MHPAAKAQIKECYEKNKSGDPQFRSLIKSMKTRLRSTVGEIYWKKAQDYLDYFLGSTEDDGDNHDTDDNEYVDHDNVDDENAIEDRA